MLWCKRHKREVKGPETCDEWKDALCSRIRVCYTCGHRTHNRPGDEPAGARDAPAAD